eukprot:gene15460-6711_t
MEEEAKSAGEDTPITSPTESINIDASDNSNDIHVKNALNLVWSFGVNRNVPVLNLSNDDRKAVFYVTAHTGVLYDFNRNRQTLFQGHGNCLSCTCVSNDKRWLATADIGPNCMVIIWDTLAGIPIQTFFEPYPDGVQSMMLSHDAKYLVTASHSVPQTVSVWDWTTERTSPICSAILEEGHGLQTHIAFHPDDPHQFVTNNGNQVIFYYWTSDSEKLHFVAPPLSDKDFNKAVGTYSQSVFLAGTERALTATSCGNIVVWSHSDGDMPCNKKAFKIVKMQEKALTVLTLCDKFIATGDVAGNVKFFDRDLKLSNWYEQFQKAGPINALSFSHSTRDTESPRPIKKGDYPSSSTLKADAFVINDLVIGTTRSNIVYFKAAGSHFEYIRQENEKSAQAIACHPKEPRICIGGFTGMLQLWDYDKKKLVASRYFGKDQEITCVGFSPVGNFIAVGFSSGRVTVVDGLILADVGLDETKSDFYHCHDSIENVAFSYDCRYLATSDMDRCVTLFKAQPNSKSQPWVYIGKQRAHYKRIVDICFGKALDEEKARLLSLGEDRVLVEYDLDNSSEDDLRLIGSDRIEQSAVPTCFAWYPPIIKEDFLLIVNNQVGLQRLPIDGNPHKSMALIAHPGQVYDLACSYNGKYVFTAGGPDCSVLMWDVNTTALEILEKLGGEDLVPFYGLLEGGKEGELFAELEDYFYYSQMRSQGVDSTEEREVSTTIPISEIPFIMRALGYYPTEQEIDDMLNEVKFSKYVETGTYVTEIAIGDFIKLYINHRPVFGLSPDQLEAAFNALAEANYDEGDSVVDRGHLLYLLQNKGEHLTEAELAEYMSTLLGLTEPSGSVESRSFDAKDASSLLQENLPEEVTAEIFATRLLGLTQ